MVSAVRIHRSFSLIRHADDAGGGQHRHLAGQDHRRLLEHEREPAALARPRHLDALDPVIGTVGARHLGRDVATVLEKVAMPPSELGEVMGLARPPAIGAGEPRSAATSMCSSLGRLSVSSRCPTSFQGGATPSPKASTSSASIVRPSVAVRQQRSGRYHAARNSHDSTWNVEEPFFCEWGVATGVHGAQGAIALKYKEIQKKPV